MEMTTHARRAYYKDVYNKVISYYNLVKFKSSFTDLDLHFFIDVDNVIALGLSEERTGQIFIARSIYPLESYGLTSDINGIRTYGQDEVGTFSFNSSDTKFTEVSEEYMKKCIETYINGAICASSDKQAIAMPGFVYFMLEPQTGNIKIGYSKNPIVIRLGGANGTMRDPSLPPCSILLQYFCKDMISEEYYLHAKFNHLRISQSKEWFFGDKYLLEFIKETDEFKEFDRGTEKNEEETQNC